MVGVVLALALDSGLAERAGNCSHEFKLSSGGGQIVCRNSPVAFESTTRG
jgi:hypothetical protein